jgi:hypothetical protein
MAKPKKSKNEVKAYKESKYLPEDIPLSAYPIAGSAWESTLDQLSEEVKQGKIPPDLKVRFKEILEEQLKKHFSNLEKQSRILFLKGLVVGVLLSVIANFFISSLFMATEGIFEKWVYGIFTLVGVGCLIYIMWYINRQIRVVD